MLLWIGISMGSGMFILGAFKARDYVERNTISSTTPGLRSLRGMLWIALAACGALQILTSVEVMARVQEKEADLIRRKTLVASLEQKIHVYRKGLKTLQGTMTQAKGAPNRVSPDKLIDDFEAMLAEIRERERKLP
jgi:hypothetical protein